MSTLNIADQADQRTPFELAAENYETAREFFDNHAENAPQAMELAMGGVIGELIWEAIEAPVTKFTDLNRKIRIAEGYGMFETLTDPGENRRIADALRKDLDRLFPVD